MIAGLKPYREYKESGLLWVDRVPAQWDVAPNRAFMRLRKVLVGARHPEYQLLSLTKEGVIIRDVESGKGKFSADMGTSQEVRTGDLVFCLFDVPETPRTVGLSRYNGMITGAYTVFECSDPLLAAFLDLFYRAMDDRKLLSPLYSGLRNTIPPPRFQGTKTPVPPRSEQAAIVRFLAHVERRIGRYTRAKRNLIALLNEQKQAIIHRAVTRGLDPNVLPTLRDIPEHWKTSRVKNEFLCLNSRRIPLSAVERGSMTVRLYNYYGASGVIDKVENYIFDDELLLIAEDGANLVLRNLPLAIIAKGKFWVNNHAHILKPKSGNIEYLASLMQTLNYLPWISGAAQPKLTRDRLMSISIVVPPPAEQDEIVDRCAKETLPLVDSIIRAQGEVKLILEYRTRLIADVVTGQLDVCEAARHLPAEIEEPEAAIEPAAEDEAEELLEAVDE